MKTFLKLLKTKKFIAAIVMALGLTLFFVGFYVVAPLAPANMKAYTIIFGFLMTIYGFINVLT